ncbi:MAG: TetR/AcrR family transcriptional regulator [Dysgonamonadaceae bacterium]|jgi:AcrR family transcriptional regulator|nr:TetR/AcrR family transcriptional regulator [Dysgonamonadaceae bacterium]
MTKKDKKTEEIILQSAEKVFFEKGYAGAKTTEIAKNSGVGHAMLHYYFRTKENLFQIVFERNVELLTNSVFSGLEKQGSFKEIIISLISNHFDFVRNNPKLVLFIINEINRNNNNNTIWKEVSAPILTKVSAQITERINKEKKTGNIRDIDPFNFIVTIISLNLFVFVAHPLINNIKHFTKKEYEAFLERRKQENIRLVLMALQP